MGVYPTVPLKRARVDRDTARTLLKDGTDPAQQRQEDKLTARLKTKTKTKTTFEGVARDWWEQWKANRSPRHADYVIRRLDVTLSGCGVRVLPGVFADGWQLRHPANPRLSVRQCWAQALGTRSKRT